MDLQTRPPPLPLLPFADATRVMAWLGERVPPARAELARYPDLADLSGTTPVACDPLRERALERDGRRAARREYGAWLAARGDPRGELIRLQASERPADGPRAAQWLRRHQRYFLGNFPRAPRDCYGDEIALGWRDGYIARAELALQLDPAGPAPAVVLRALFALPSARFLEELSLAVEPWAWQDPGHHRHARWTDALVAAGGCATVRVLELTSPRPALRAECGDESGASAEAHARREDVAAIRRALPRLERMVLVDEPAAL